MTRNTLFAAMVFGMMTLMSNSMMAQGHHRDNGRRGNNYGYRNDRGMGRRDGGHHEFGRGPGEFDRGPREFDRGHGFREMHGHRWDHDGWMEGYHGRVRHFDDGRWGYLRDGRWYYYDRFYEPDYFYGHPISHFHDHVYYREMHGHRWDHDGWMDGYHGRVRYFNDGRWGYLRDGSWYYYDRFYEPDYFYGHPLTHFRGHRVRR